MRALDLFAGTGWAVACKRLGIQEMGVELMPEACATREANGMATIYHDVWEGLLDELWVPDYDLLIASPPCQTFSLAGHGAGRKALDDVLEAVYTGQYMEPSLLREFGERHDERTALVLTPLAHVYRDQPRLVTFEQVPTVLPVWEACASVMREMGYSVWTGVLHAEQYGVPQTRKRAILAASLDSEVSPPVPTHSRYYSRDPGKLDDGVLPWVSMAEALGWGLVRITEGEAAALRSYPTMLRSNYGSGGDPRNRGVRSTGHPAPTVTTKIDRNKWDGKASVTAAEAAALQSYPMAVKNMGRGMVERYGDRPGRSASDPAFTIRAGAGGTEPGGFVIQDEEGGPTRKLVTAEASSIQTFEPPFIWCGSKTKVFLQIGNAVPPLLAEAILGQLTGLNRAGVNNQEIGVMK
jgi:DNA (cytosine-5)-methyltransferase 1